MGNRNLGRPCISGLWGVVMGAAFWLGSTPATAQPPAGVLQKSSPPVAEKEADWQSLIDAKSLAGWKQTEYGTQAEVRVEAGVLQIEMGEPINGVTITPEAFKKLPKIDYEMTLEAQRAVGGDFFVGLTFPVREESCSLIMGGWGGGLIGLSSLDGFDASENETTTYHPFKNEQWYQVRLQVTGERIVVWLDKEKVIDVEIADRKVSTRIEVTLSEPLGLSSFQSTAHIRNFKIRPLPAKK